MLLGSSFLSTSFLGGLLFLLEFDFLFELTGAALGEQPCHVIGVLLLRGLYEVPALEVLEVIIAEFVQLVVELLEIFKPELHHGRSFGPVFMQLQPPPGLI